MHRIQLKKRKRDFLSRQKISLSFSFSFRVQQPKPQPNQLCKSACGSRNAISNGSSENDERKGKGRSSMMRARRDPCL